jgi:hypothetical protein
MATRLDPKALLMSTAAFHKALAEESMNKDELEQLGYSLYFQRDFDNLVPDDQDMTKALTVHLLKAEKAALVAYAEEMEARQVTQPAPESPKTEPEKAPEVVQAEVVKPGEDDSDPASRQYVNS